MSTKAIAGTTTRTISASWITGQADEPPPPSNARRNDAPPSSRSSATSTPSTGWATTAIALTPRERSQVEMRRRARGDWGVGISDRGEHLYPAWHMIDEDAIRNRSGTASPRDARVADATRAFLDIIHAQPEIRRSPPGVCSIGIAGFRNAMTRLGAPPDVRRSIAVVSTAGSPSTATMWASQCCWSSAA